jgi:major type 1 subunit fimbrin (pilin)
MRIKLLTAVLATLLTPMAHAVDGTIDFTGTILATACTVDAGSANQTVDLGTIGTDAFSAPGDTASIGRIAIVVDNCDAAVTRIATRFDGPLDVVNSNLLALTTGGASGVAIGIYEQDGSTLINMGEGSVGKAAPTSGPTTLDYVAKYVSTGPSADITAGVANAAATFTLVYN